MTTEANRDQGLGREVIAPALVLATTSRRTGAGAQVPASPQPGPPELDHAVASQR